MTRLTPRFLEKVWGATHLQPWFPDSPLKIGEVWLEGDPSLPLLIKFLFTTDKLSVQVHPGDEYAQARHGSLGKTEMWHVLRADPGALIASGFREPISKERLEAASRSGEIESLLNWIPARPGDSFFLPAGTVHAIGGGLAMLEVQQNSDVTYRLYDYGRPRELHLEDAIAVSDLGLRDPRSVAQGDVLVACSYFVTRRVTVSGPRELSSTGTAHQYLIVVEGNCNIDGEPASAGNGYYLADNHRFCTLDGNAICLHISAP